ncbi:hypothetical protein TcWFU_006343 [Taenia crassiceps]|uniref:Uncharacterized protein n=1 Tax=Taenia crassiceps TaxID=6207 RepID=A0ABR4QHN2_9CEST
MENSEFAMSKEGAHQNLCIRQAILNKSSFTCLSTDFEEDEIGEMCDAKGVPKFLGAVPASKIFNGRRKRSACASDSNFFAAADVKLITAPEDGTTGSSQSALPSLPLRTNLSTSKRSYKAFQGMNNFLNGIIPAVSSLIGSESSKQELLISPDYGPCKHQIAATPDYLFRRATPEETAKEVAQLRDALSTLNSRFRNAGITTKNVARELKHSYRRIILVIRSRLSSERGVVCQNSTKALGATLMQCVEQFVHIVDDRVMRHKWLEAWDRGCLLRLKADFIRYLYEAFPANLTYQLKCREAYKSARLFFLEHGLQDKAEWVYLQMNYATFLHMLGDGSTARFINERLINSLVVRRCGKDIKAKLQLNLQFYSKLR